MAGAWMRAAGSAALGCGFVAATGSAVAQVPDLLSSVDAGSRAIALGGSTTATDITPHAALLNPAGLGYISAPPATVAFRNLPDTLTLASGNLATPTVVSIRRYGRTTLTHAGYATPMGAGTFGFNYSLAGYSLDERVGQNLTVPAGSVTGYSSFLKAQTDFFTFSYGQASDRMSWGLGLVIANQYLRLSERYGVTAGGVQVGTVDATATGTSNGIGAVGGVQMPMGDDAMLGVSVRTPISLQGNSDTTDLYSVIPGTASLGYVARTNPESRTGDFLTYSAQLDWFFGGSGVGRFERDSTLAGGFGLEYSLNRADARWPIRLGWRFNPAQGPTFESRDGYSLGLGWRPDGGALGIDLSLFRSTRGGPYDAALGLTYQLGR